MNIALASNEVFGGDADAAQGGKSEHSGIAAHNQQFYRDVIEGFSQPQKQLSPKYFYDVTGSQYFDAICHLDEYYPYRTELTLLPLVADALAERLQGEYAIVEFGAGSLAKISPFLKAISGVKHFAPIDISGDFLRHSVAQLRPKFPSVEMTPIEGDFTQPVDLPEFGCLQKIGFFPGSTIGNFQPEQAKLFLKNAMATLGQDAYMVIGVDTKKDPNTLHKAYNDSLDITKKFNLNVLARINRELHADFDLNAFEHYAFYNPVKGCIEMHLVSLRQQQVTIAGQRIDFSDGESIHTESSYKYTQADFADLAGSAGWSIEEAWRAPGDMFSVFLMHAE